MKRRYRRHFDDYAIGENEKLYSDMAARGWFLEKRGAYFSRFRRGEPADMRYRIEVSAPRFLEETDLPEEQVAVYEDCGWEYVTSRGMIHVFASPAGSDAPEFYADPAQQAATLRVLRRGYIWAWVPVTLMLLFNFFMAAAMSGGTGKLLSKWGAECRLGWVAATALFLFAGALVAWAFYLFVHAAWRMGRLYRRMKKGVPLDYSPRGRMIPHRVVSGVLLGFVAVFGLLTLWQWVSRDPRDLPETADGPYVLLADLGIEGERSALFYDDRTSKITVERSLLATHYDVFECVAQGDDGESWMYQDVYRLSPRADRKVFVRSLMEDATFARGPENFREVTVAGLEGAWISGDLECIAVKGDLAAYVTVLGSGRETEETLLAALRALAECWAQEGGEVR